MATGGPDAPIDNGNAVRSSATGSTDSTGATTSQGSTIPLPSRSEPGCPAVSTAHVSGPISPSTCRPFSDWKVRNRLLGRRSEVAVGDERHVDGDSQLLLYPAHCWTLVTQPEWILVIESVVGALRRQWRCTHGGRRRFGHCVVARECGLGDWLGRRWRWSRRRLRRGGSQTRRCQSDCHAEGRPDDQDAGDTRARQVHFVPSRFQGESNHRQLPAGTTIHGR